MFEVMAEFEALCGRFAAMRISSVAVTELEAANDACRAAVAQEDAEAYYQENERFHHIIYRESGNGFLEQEVRCLHRRLRPFRRMQLLLRGRMAQSLAEHEHVLAALRAGHEDAASDALRAHVAIQGDKFHRLMAARRGQRGSGRI